MKMISLLFSNFEPLNENERKEEVDLCMLLKVIESSKYAYLIAGAHSPNAWCVSSLFEPLTESDT